MLVGLCVAAVTVLGAGRLADAVTAGWSLPLDQSVINGNSGPLTPGVCHHAACGSVADNFWAVDLSGSTSNNVYAELGGYVRVKTNDASCGNMARVMVSSAASSESGWIYCHMSSLASGYSSGGWVSTGQILGKVGSTGSGSGGTVHLHLELRWLSNASVWSSNFYGRCTRPQVVSINTNQANPWADAWTGYSSISGTIYSPTCS